MTSLPVRKSRNFSFTPLKPHKQQRVREYILYCEFLDFKQFYEFLWDLKISSYRLSYRKVPTAARVVLGEIKRYLRLQRFSQLFVFNSSHHSCLVFQGFWCAFDAQEKKSIIDGLFLFQSHEDSTALVDAVKNLADDGKYLNQPLELELYTSNNFMGMK